MHVHAKKDITVQLASKRWDLTEKILRASVQGMDTLLRTIDVTSRIYLTPLLDFLVSVTRVGFPTLATMHVPVKLVLIHHALSAPSGITYSMGRATSVQVDPSPVPVT